MIDIEKALQDIANVIGILAGAITIAKLLKGKTKQKGRGNKPRSCLYLLYIMKILMATLLLLSVVRAFVAQDLLSILSTIILSIALLLLTKKDLGR